jgi:Leucine-rich repeat (LRR) protein
MLLLKLVLLSVGWHALPGDMFHRLISLKSLQLGNNNIVSLSLNNPFKYMKGLEFLGLGANKLNTFHEMRRTETKYVVRIECLVDESKYCVG